MKVVDSMAIDSHMHVNTSVLENVPDCIEDINKNVMIKGVINVGLNIATSEESIIISRKNPKFYSAIGIHPLYTDLQDIDCLYRLAESDKVLAIGEIGLDDSKDNFNEQKEYLIRQIIIANELHLPVIIHSNNSNKLVIEIFEKYVKPKYGCVFHCFQPETDVLKYLVRNGYYISFAGRITYKTAKKSIEVAKMIPNDLFLVETDSPYISPEPHRGEVNSSSNLKYIISKVAEVKGMGFEDVESITTENTKRLFKKMC